MVFQSDRLRPFNVMVVDDDIVHLLALEKILSSFGARYQMFKYINPVDALVALRDQNNKFDILFCGVPLSNVHAFDLVRVAELKFNIAVIAMISNSTDEAAFRGILIGASKCVAKPITNPQILKDIWQHVVRKRRDEFTISFVNSLAKNSSENQQKSIRAAAVGGAGPSCSNNPIGVKIVEEGGGISDQDVPKKPRFVWNEEYQKVFLEAVASIKPPERVIPTKVLEYMKTKGVPNITRENVASHLQKHRMLLERYKDNNVINHQSSTSLDENKEPSSSYQDHQTLALPQLGSSSSPQILTIQEQQLPPQNQPNENAAIIPTSNVTDQNNNGDIDWRDYLTESSPLDQPQHNSYHSEYLNFNYECDYNFHNSYDFDNMSNSAEFQLASQIQKDELKE